MRVHAFLCLLIWSVPVQCQRQLVVGGVSPCYLSSVEIFPPPSSDTCSIPDLPSPSFLGEGWLYVGGIRFRTKNPASSLGQEGAPAGPTCTPPARQELLMWLGFHHLFLTPSCCSVVLMMQQSSLPRLCQVEEPLICIAVDMMPVGFPTKTRL